MEPCYDPLRPRWRQPLTTTAVTALAVAAAAGAAAGDVRTGAPVVLGIALVVTGVDRSTVRWMVVVVVLVGVGAALRSGYEVGRLEPRAVGFHRGWAIAIDDPRSFDHATRVIVEVDGQRFELWTRGDDQQRLDDVRAGDLVHLVGERRRLADDRAGRVAWQHVVGQYRAIEIGSVAPGSRLAVASNRVRAAIERGSAELPDEQAALFRGLVVGDRRGQPAELVERFRATGLSHLTVVSGLNVSLLLVAAAPALGRLPRSARWMTTLALIGWFVALTRFEPSIMRAGMMAAISATAFATGRDRAPWRVLCVAVTLLLLIDPLLVRSVGFWLSVGATAGVCSVGPWVADRLPGPRWLAAPLGMTAGAQVGVVIPLVAVFGRIPLVSVPANLLAVPVASAVKLYGLPASLVSGTVPPVAPILMAPMRIGVWWVDGVAVVAERLEPAGAAATVGWVLMIAAFVVALAVAAAKNRRRDDGPPPHR